VSAMDHGDPGIEWGEANAANEDGQAIADAERAAAEQDTAAEGQPVWERTLTGYFGDALTIAAYPPGEDEPGAVTIVIRDGGDEASILLERREAREDLGQAWREALRVADGSRLLVFDLSAPRLGWVLTEALDMWAAAQREKAAFEGGNEQREAWAAIADAARAQVEAVP
jgi:hypothetical protein